MNIENIEEMQHDELIQLALVNLEYIFTEYKDFGAHEEEFKARAYAAYQLILEFTCGGYEEKLAFALCDVDRFDEIRKKAA